MDSERQLLYVAELYGCRIHVLSLDGSFVRTFGTLGREQEPGQFFNPRGVALNAAGELAVIATANFCDNLVKANCKLRMASQRTALATGSFVTTGLIG